MIRVWNYQKQWAVKDTSTEWAAFKVIKRELTKSYWVIEEWIWKEIRGFMIKSWEGIVEMISDWVRVMRLDQTIASKGWNFITELKWSSV